MGLFSSKRNQGVQVSDVVKYQADIEAMMQYCKRQVEVGLKAENTKYWKQLPTWAKRRVEGYANDRDQYALRGHNL